MGFLFIWIIFACIIGAIATDRAMGFWGGFLWSFLLSPIIGLIIVLLSKTRSQQRMEQQMQYNQVQQTAVLHQMQQQHKQTNQQSVADELSKLKSQLDNGIITQEEFQKLKNKLIAQFD